MNEVVADALSRAGVGQEVVRRAQSGDPLGSLDLAFDAGLVQGGEVDPSDPDFAAVDGVDVDRYARVCRSIVDAKTNTEDEMHEVLRAQGVDPATWKGIAETWNERIMRSAPVKLRYSKVFVDPS